MTVLVRADYEKAQCEFRPQNGGWSSRCRERATLVRTNGWSQYDQRRCERHANTDVRTATRRGWGDVPVFAPFDAQAELVRLLAEKTAQEQHAQALANHDALLQDLKNALGRKALSEVDTKVIERMLAAYSA